MLSVSNLVAASALSVNWLTGVALIGQLKH